jgi:hypothetical protein
MAAYCSETSANRCCRQRDFAGRVKSVSQLQVGIDYDVPGRNCAIPQRINLQGAKIPRLDLDGSYTGEIEGKTIGKEVWTSFKSRAPVTRAPRMRRPPGSIQREASESTDSHLRSEARRSRS